MSRRRRRYSESAAGDDPLTLVPNLFDVAIVLAVAFLVAALSISGKRDQVQDKSGQMESGLRTAGKKVEDAQDRRKSAGKGVRLGTAYRLENGEIIYVPE